MAQYAEAFQGRTEISGDLNKKIRFVSLVPLLLLHFHFNSIRFLGVILGIYCSSYFPFYHGPDVSQAMVITPP